MIGRNPYEVLGVPREASAAAIHNAYRKLAMRWHPDLNPGNARAEERFKEIAAAYEILSQAARRAQFDRDNSPPPNDADQGERPHYSPDAGYAAEPDWGLELGFYVGRLRQARRRQKTKPNWWLIALAAWIALAYANGMLRGYGVGLDGVIESVEHVPPPLMHAALYFGPFEYVKGDALEYKIRGTDGRVETFLAGPACSFLSDHPARARGSHLHKEAWHWTYELNGHLASPFGHSSTSLLAPNCAVYGLLRSIAFVFFLALGLLWRPHGGGRV